MHLGMRIISDTAFFFFHPDKYIMFKRPATNVVVVYLILCSQSIYYSASEIAVAYTQ